MTWFEEVTAKNQDKWQKMFEEALKKTLKGKDETPAMQVSYNGFAGELVKLQQYSCGTGRWTYELNIYDSEKKCTYLFTGVKLEDLKFLGGAVSFQ